MSREAVIGDAALVLARGDLTRFPAAAPVALGAVHGWLSDHPRSGVTGITFVFRSEDVLDAFERALDELATGE